MVDLPAIVSELNNVGKLIKTQTACGLDETAVIAKHFAVWETRLGNLAFVPTSTAESLTDAIVKGPWDKE